jgi:hypothetical protein
MMRGNGVPRLAIWLLGCLGAGSATESLAGDLVEEHRYRRSTLWVWTQVFAAIAIGAWQEIRTHRLAAMSGVVTGLASLWCLTAATTLLLTGVGFPHAVDWQWPHRLVLLAIGFADTMASGWIVGRVHRSYRAAAVFTYLASIFIVATIELPLLYWLAPSLFFVTVVPLLPLALIGAVIGAPVAILMGGFWDQPRYLSQNG